MIEHAGYIANKRGGVGIIVNTFLFEVFLPI